RWVGGEVLVAQEQRSLRVVPGDRAGCRIESMPVSGALPRGHDVAVVLGKAPGLGDGARVTDEVDVEGADPGEPRQQGGLTGDLGGLHDQARARQLSDRVVD